MTCLQTIEYPKYGSDKWCNNVMLAPCVPLVPTQLRGDASDEPLEKQAAEAWSGDLSRSREELRVVY
jgi:hypothetical protein